MRSQVPPAAEYRIDLLGPIITQMKARNSRIVWRLHLLSLPFAMFNQGGYVMLIND